MGMYDGIQFYGDVGEGVDPQHVYQTKSLACRLDQYFVDVDGRLGKNGRIGTKETQYTGEVRIFQPDGEIVALFDEGRLLVVRVISYDDGQGVAADADE